VQVFLCDDTDVFAVIVPPKAQPLLPFPGALTPGIPEPAYAVVIDNQPFNEEVESITVPGAATQTPAVLPENWISNLDKDVLTNLNVKYCGPERPELKFGPTGK